MNINAVLKRGAFALALVVSTQAIAYTPPQEDLLNTAVDIGYLIKSVQYCNTDGTRVSQIVDVMAQDLKEGAWNNGLAPELLADYVQAGADQAESEFRERIPTPLRCIELETELMGMTLQN